MILTATKLYTHKKITELLSFIRNCKPMSHNKECIPHEAGKKSRYCQRMAFALKARNDNAKAATLSEKLMYAKLEYHGIKFDYQYIIDYGKGIYIADFFIPKYTLVLEVDGGYHKTKIQQDAQRDSDMKDMGYNVLRVKNQDVEFFNTGKIRTFTPREILLPDIPFLPYLVTTKEKLVMDRKKAKYNTAKKKPKTKQKKASNYVWGA